MGSEKSVTKSDALVAAANDKSIQQIVVSGHLTDAPTIRLSPRQALRGFDKSATVTFADGRDGIQLTSNNRIGNLRLEAAPDKRAIFNDTAVDSLGRIELRNLTTTGRVQIIARDRVRGGHVHVDGLDIIAADARGETERPHGYGVYVLHGAFTLWNMQPDQSVEVTADLVGLSAGRDGAPFREVASSSVVQATKVAA